MIISFFSAVMRSIEQSRRISLEETRVMKWRKCSGQRLFTFHQENTGDSLNSPMQIIVSVQNHPIASCMLIDETIDYFDR